MKKKIFGRQLGRSRKARRALFRSQVRAIVLNGKITTTKAKAKAIQGMLENLISRAGKRGLSQRRQILAELGNDRKVVDTLFVKIAPAFSGRKGGFTKIVPLPPRHGDLAEMVRMEWTEQITDKKSTPKAVIQPKKKEKIKTESKKKS